MMKRGFFSPHDLAQQAKQPPLLAPRCGLCQLYKRCRSPKMPVAGQGRKGILICGEAPGANEDEQGKPFVGDSGRLLRDALDQAGVDLDRDCWSTNALICRPWETTKKGQNRDRNPMQKEVDYCRPNINAAIKELKPRIVIPLGTMGVRSVIGLLFRNNPGSIYRWVGWRIPSQQINAWVCPNWNPNEVLEYEHDEVLRLLFGEHLRDAVACEGRPWPDGPPDWQQQVECIVDCDAAAEEINSYVWLLENHDDHTPVAWDIETDRLKPDDESARIVCCSMSSGVRTIAFPWHGKARQAFLKFLRSDVPKIGYNAKFEHRWLLAREGVRVRNWIWDGMLAAHVLDNRGDSCSLDFQAFTQLGFGDWSSRIEPWLKSKQPGCNSPNRVRELDLKSLLFYCGTDSLIEWHLANKQMKQAGIVL